MFYSLRLFARVPRVPVRVPAGSLRWNSSTSPATPPLLATLRTDLKTAMRAKDTSRLNVLRALISETNNAAKTTSPITTDIQLLSLIRRRQAASREAAKQFAAADRSDLKDQEEAQIAVLDEYAGQVKTVSTEELREAITRDIEAIKADGGKPNPGILIKRLAHSPGGSLNGKPVDMRQLAALAQEIIAA
ncbi:hypothetical protein NUU61_009592 [Penicillium alfredii]|uniref:Altered inheritance of mitochondria protein 41 n=1 Tax=Penicillium alfredii TaxID=1506179 RepID=A0A9W9JTI8_9EURO|nr:uncharacterized protein NUU61_009592 [Penicillium alfredii]KAJ5081328.1 hypothetical protein NUU61_009592 [Penicillium alfredii]